MSQSQSQNLAAIIPGVGQLLKIESRPIASPKDNEVLVRNFAIAGNPSDKKVQDRGVFVKQWPAIVGSDVAGVVEAVGKDVHRLKPGDRVCGMCASLINQDPDHGGWQTFTILREMTTTKLPDDMSFTDAACVPAGSITAAMGLFTALQIHRERVKVPTSILIWGASSSVGSAAVQIASAFGYTVYAAAGKQHHPWVKDLGAKEVFDHRDPDIASKVLAVAREDSLPIQLAFDAISLESTLSQTADILAYAGGTLATTVHWAESHQFPSNVKPIMTITMQHDNIHSDIGRWFFAEWLETSLANGTYKPAPKASVVPGGIYAAQEVFDLMGKGVSGEKLVVQVESEKA